MLVTSLVRLGSIESYLVREGCWEAVVKAQWSAHPITWPALHSHIPLGFPSQQPASRCLCLRKAGIAYEFSPHLQPLALNQCLRAPWVLHPGPVRSGGALTLCWELPCGAEPRWASMDYIPHGSLAWPLLKLIPVAPPLPTFFGPS